MSYPGILNRCLELRRNFRSVNVLFWPQPANAKEVLEYRTRSQSLICYAAAQGYRGLREFSLIVTSSVPFSPNWREILIEVGSPELFSNIALAISLTF